MQPASRKAPARQRPASNAAKAAVLGDVPGPYEEAALKHYFERGSLQVVERNNWRTLSTILAGALVMAGVGFWQLIPLKTVEIALVSKGSDGRAAVEFAGGTWTPDTDMKAAWLSDWGASLTEINAATWERGVARATTLAAGTGRDQIRDYLRQEGNQPAVLLKDQPAYVREFKLLSVNAVQDNVLLLRFSLTSRPKPGEKPRSAAFALTATLQTIKPETHAQALSNPTGLAVSNFSIAEDHLK
jgi:hypothetical protein